MVFVEIVVLEKVAEGLREICFDVLLGFFSGCSGTVYLGEQFVPGLETELVEFSVDVLAICQRAELHLILLYGFIALFAASEAGA